uniref:Glycosyl hydrolase family 13 catalytic domain-containing protein n=1 Tax=Biomphalaria glabrata TaxID=6526 RepID=A0A2C9K4W5_BIOGL
MAAVIVFLVLLLFSSGSEVSADGNVTLGVTLNLTWWQEAVFYQIYPRSFQDSNGDGVGDLKGITSRIDYLKDLGIDCIWLSPICRSPMKDFGYDCSDAEDIDPIFGNLDDFKELLQVVHNKGLKLIVDFVPGYTSDQHIWFQKSVRREGKYTNYYIWDDGKLLDNGTRAPPSNWLSIFEGPAWEWNEVRQQYYYHVFLKEQPEMNFRDENVKWEMKNLLRYWLDLGVDGFRADAITAIVTASNHSLDEPLSGKDVPPDQDDYLDHIYTQNQPEIGPILKEWYDILDEYTEKDGRIRFMVLETYATHEVRNSLYSQGQGNPFNFDFLDMSRPASTREIYDTIMQEYTALLPGKWPNFVLGNHDNNRVSARNGYQYVDVFNMLLLTLKGTPTMYYGEELGMLQADISWNQTIDRWGLNFGPDRYQNFSRDPERTPMQWTDGPHAGFTTGNKTWLPLGKNYTSLNVKVETESPGQTSLKMYKQLTALRKNPAFTQGSFKTALVTDDVISYQRQLGDDNFLVVLNFGKETTVDVSSYGGLTGTVSVITPSMTSLKTGETVSLNNLKLGVGDGLVLKVKSSSSSEIIG